VLLKCNNKLYGTVITVKSQYYSGQQVFVTKHSIWALIYVPEAQKYFNTVSQPGDEFLLSTQVPTVTQIGNSSFFLRTTK